ncbi:UNVERIFIED_CONTAM: hypothetical protein PYX00_009614 [Menopon gallinae]|uniref:RING-type domain-containing protein n=1 Tax=Menopon gallinae TaxID=328185 RepID=A0AAW2HBV9_9NEOP
MEEGNSSWSNERDRATNNNFQTSTVTPLLYNCIRPIRSSQITRLAQNLSRNHGPLTLGRAQEEGSRLIRNNINSVMAELGPLVDPSRSREGGGLNLRSWIRRHQDRTSSQNPVLVTAESTVIDFGISNEPIETAPQATVFQPGRSTSQQYPLASIAAPNLLDGSNGDNYVSEQPDASTNDNQNPNSTNNGVNNTTITAGSNNVENTQTDETNADTQSIVSFFHKYVLFLIILLGKAIYDHRAGILIFLALLVTFAHADSVVKREIAKQNRRSLLSLFVLFIKLFFCICFIYYVFQDQQLYKSLILIPPYSQPLSLWDLLWIVGITDFVLKFITIQIKVGMACFPASLLPYSARGKWYLFLECISQLYRGLVPIQPWLYYFLESYQGPEKVIGFFLSVAYMVSKGTDLMSKVKLFKMAFWKLLQNVSLGVSPSKEQLDTAGSQCPICHDDYDKPVLLHCGHVFCEACVTTWFDREQTCPLCRTKVADDPTWKDGATTFFAQLF